MLAGCAYEISSHSLGCYSRFRDGFFHIYAFRGVRERILSRKTFLGAALARDRHCGLANHAVLPTQHGPRIEIPRACAPRLLVPPWGLSRYQLFICETLAGREQVKCIGHQLTTDRSDLRECSRDLTVTSGAESLVRTVRRLRYEPSKNRDSNRSALCARSGGFVPGESAGSARPSFES